MRSVHAALFAALATLFALAPSMPRGNAWGTDINPGAGPKLAAEAHAELLEIVKAAPAERAAKAEALATRRAVAAIEAWKRFRNPELVALARACVKHADWKVAHRGLHWSRCLNDPAVLEAAVALLDHEQPRLREKAALTLLEAWDPKKGKELAGGKVKERVAQKLAAETDPHLVSALHALERRLQGKLTPERVADEVVVACEDGLQWTPFLDGMDKLGTVAPGVRLVTKGSPSGTSAQKLPVAASWIGPLTRWPDEEVPGAGLQPFANLRQNGTVYHTGQDLGASLDGAGYYALADGVVRWVYSGSDMGTLLVVEHRRAAKELVNAVYMHGGAIVFVKSGDKVSAGQLLGTMGLSFSIENGGHFAHLHLGLYPGAFDPLHNYGYKPVSAGLSDWLDPATVLPEWIAASKR